LIRTDRASAFAASYEREGDGDLGVASPANTIVMPQTRYARSGDVHVAYQVFGDGPTTVVFLPQWTTHIEVLWEEPAVAEFLEALGSFARVILFDKRGVGLSDPVTLDDDDSMDPWIDDLNTVIDSVGVDRVSLVASGSAGPVAMLFAAMHPERVASLVLANTYACRARKADYPIGLEDDEDAKYRARRIARWGSGESLRIFAPSVADQSSSREWYGRYERLAASPGTADVMHQVIRALDVRAALPAIHVPVLVVHSAAARGIPVEHGRYLADHLPNGTLVELPSADGFVWFDAAEAFLAETEEFLTGHRRSPEPDRVLATIVFSDIAGSTAMAGSLGDQDWRRVLGRYHEMVRRHIAGHRGRLVKSTGDGALAVFDAPGRAIRFALAVRETGRALGLETTAGIHIGEVELVGDDIAGINVHIAARIQGAASAGQVLVSASVPPLVAGSGITFTDLGARDLKGLTSPLSLLEVADGRSAGEDQAL
jgi:pimeloyl-ACP methyl ester carboxylesterase/class 3 adenylate cyclase